MWNAIFGVLASLKYHLPLNTMESLVVIVHKPVCEHDVIHLYDIMSML